mmetsp:Transcript_405/g.847  ORF Transcript_405/g.847 Transcript_405/m.847 type:complete len:259 (-) Transcript_405:966-1742(-)
MARREGSRPCKLFVYDDTSPNTIPLAAVTWLENSFPKCQSDSSRVFQPPAVGTSIRHFSSAYNSIMLGGANWKFSRCALENSREISFSCDFTVDRIVVSFLMSAITRLRARNKDLIKSSRNGRALSIKSRFACAVDSYNSESVRLNPIVLHATMRAVAKKIPQCIRRRSASSLPIISSFHEAKNRVILDRTLPSLLLVVDLAGFPSIFSSIPPTAVSKAATCSWPKLDSLSSSSGDSSSIRALSRSWFASIGLLSTTS